MYEYHSVTLIILYRFLIIPLQHFFVKVKKYNKNRDKWLITFNYKIICIKDTLNKSILPIHFRILSLKFTQLFKTLPDSFEIISKTASHINTKWDINVTLIKIIHLIPTFLYYVVAVFKKRKH